MLSKKSQNTVAMAGTFHARQCHGRGISTSMAATKEAIGSGEDMVVAVKEVHKRPFEERVCRHAGYLHHCSSGGKQRNVWPQWSYARRALLG